MDDTSLAHSRSVTSDLLKETSGDTTRWEWMEVEPREDGRICLRIRMKLRQEPDPSRGRRPDLSKREMSALRSIAETASDPELRRAATAVRSYAIGNSLQIAANAADRTVGWLRRLLQAVERGGIEELEKIRYRPKRANANR
jgi:hypothetical protein